MDEHLKQLGLDLLGRGLDFVVAKATAPKKSHAEERMERIDRTLEALESTPEVGRRWTTPPAEAPQSQKDASSPPVATISPQSPGNPSTVATEVPPTVATVSATTGVVDDEYCVGCGPNNHLAKAQSHIQEALRLSRGKQQMIANIVAPRIQDAVAELGGYEDGDIKHMREKATGTLAEILDDLAIQTRDLRNFLRYDVSGLEIGNGTIEDLETAAVWISKLRQLGYYSVMVEVGQKAKVTEVR